MKASALMSLVLLASCSQVSYQGTASFARKTRSLPISPAEAAQRLKWHEGMYRPVPYALVDGWYFSPSVPEKVQIRFTGWYVSGISGALEYRKSPDAVWFGRHPWFRIRYAQRGSQGPERPGER